MSRTYLGPELVKAKHLEEVMEGFNKEQSTKVAQALHAYHIRYIVPLRQRLDWLELPLRVRAWRVTLAYAAVWASRFRRWRSSGVETPQHPTPVPEVPAETPATEGDT